MELEADTCALTEQVDQLESALMGGWHVPGTRRIFVNHARVAELIDQIRVCAPQQARAARQLLAMRDQVLWAAQTEADGTLAQARRHSQPCMAGAALDEQAAQRAAAIEERARQTAAAIERQADEDAAEWLRLLYARLYDVAELLAQQLPLPERREVGRSVDANASIMSSTSARGRTRAA